MLPTICVLQTNPTAGDLQHNARALLQAARQAHAQGARLLLAGHMALCATPLHDLAQLADFAPTCAATLQDMAAQLADLPDLWLITSHSQGITMLHQGQATLLQPAPAPNTPPAPCLLDLPHLRLALLVANDADEISTNANTTTNASIHATASPALAGAQLLCVLAAVPWRMCLSHQREQHYSGLAQRLQLPVLYCNIAGGQEAQVYDGGSFAVQANGALAGRARSFEADNWLVQLRCTHHAKTGHALTSATRPVTLHASTAPAHAPDATLGLLPCLQNYSSSAVWHALVLGLRDYVRKSGFRQAILGLSGGVDSALVLALAVDALGREQVQAVMMPSPYTADISRTDARSMASSLGVAYHEIPIAETFNAFCDTLHPLLPTLPASMQSDNTTSTSTGTGNGNGSSNGSSSSTTAENLQARIRGTLLMALSNQWGALVLACGNKSELATGYCTLYGDMAGGFAPIKDVLKTQVYALARWRNAHDPFGSGSHPIPNRIITRAPSAELRPNQTDQDSLPPYEVLDAIVLQYMDRALPIATLLANGLPEAAVQQITRLIHASAHKRQQAATGTRISHRAFDCG